MKERTYEAANEMGAAGIVSLVFAASIIVHVTTLRTKLPGEEMTPDRHSAVDFAEREERDGVEIAATNRLAPDPKAACPRS